MKPAKAKSQNRCEMPPMRFLGQFCGVPEGKAVLRGCSQNRRFFARQFSREKCKMSPLDWQSAFNSESDCPRALESFSLISRAIPAPPSDSRRQAQTVPFPSTPRLPRQELNRLLILLCPKLTQLSPFSSLFTHKSYH